MTTTLESSIAHDSPVLVVVVEFVDVFSLLHLVPSVIPDTPCCISRTINPHLPLKRPSLVGTCTSNMECLGIANDHVCLPAVCGVGTQVGC